MRVRIQTSIYLYAAGIMFAMVLAACAPFGPPPDPELGRQQLQRAEQLFNTRQYEPAAEQIALAAHNLPHDGQLAARQGEILEQLERFDAARDAYQRGLKQADGNLTNLRYQLARLEAYHFKQLDRAEELAQQLPTGSWKKADIDALVMIRRGETLQALTQLAELAKDLPDQSAASFIAFDTALAYEQHGEVRKAFASLFESVNRVQHKGLSRHIENYWNYLNQTYPLK